MYFGSFYNYTNEKAIVPTSYRLCFSDFLFEYKYKSIKKKNLHIWLDILNDFSEEDINIFFSEFKEYFDFDYKIEVLTDDPGFDYKKIVKQQSDLTGQLEVGEKYLVFTIDTLKNDQGSIKFLYHVSRMLHEANYTIDICKRTIELKKEMPGESILSLLKFSTAVQSKHLFERYHTVFYPSVAPIARANKIKESIIEFKMNHICKDCFYGQYIKDLRDRSKDKDIEELVKLYKSL